MKHNLTTLYDFTIRHYPELQNKAIPFLEPYCLESNLPASSDLPASADLAASIKPFHYGFNSLKWLIYTIRDLPAHDNHKVFEVFFNVVTEHLATDRPDTDIQHRILSYKAALPYKDMKKAMLPAPDELPFLKIGQWLFCINDTPYAITSRIFKQTRADAIIFRNEDIRSAGIVYRVVSPINTLTAPKSELFMQLSKHGVGWTAILDPRLQQVNLIINPGHKAEGKNYFTDITVDELTEIVKNVYQNEIQ